MEGRPVIVPYSAHAWEKPTKTLLCVCGGGLLHTLAAHSGCTLFCPWLQCPLVETAFVWAVPWAHRPSLFTIEACSVFVIRPG